MSLQSTISTVAHAGLQIVVGGTTGTLMDAVFPVPNTQGSRLDALNAIEMTTEAGLQIMANALVAGSVYKFLGSFLGSESGDASLGFAYTLTVIETQPHLKQKISLLSDYYYTKLTDTPKVFGYTGQQNVVPKAGPQNNKSSKLATGAIDV